jgi:hypothetical protein
MAQNDDLTATVMSHPGAHLRGPSHLRHLKQDDDGGGGDGGGGNDGGGGSGAAPSTFDCR